jgi:hypothetical protein
MGSFCGYRVISSDCYPNDEKAFYRKVDIDGLKVEIRNWRNCYLVEFKLGEHSYRDEVHMGYIVEHLFAIELQLMVERSSDPMYPDTSRRVYCDYESGRYWFYSSDRKYRYIWDFLDKWFRVSPFVDVRSTMEGDSMNLLEWRSHDLQKLVELYNETYGALHPTGYDKVGLTYKGTKKTFNNLDELQEFLDSL